MQIQGVTAGSLLWNPKMLGLSWDKPSTSWNYQIIPALQPRKQSQLSPVSYNPQSNSEMPGADPLK